MERTLSPADVTEIQEKPERKASEFTRFVVVDTEGNAFHVAPEEKWYPNGLLIQKLVLDYASRLAHAWGTVEMKNPIIIRGDHNVLDELMGEFHERDDRVDGGRGVCYFGMHRTPSASPLSSERPEAGTNLGSTKF